MKSYPYSASSMHLTEGEQFLGAVDYNIYPCPLAKLNINTTRTRSVLDSDPCEWNAYGALLRTLDPVTLISQYVSETLMFELRASSLKIR